MKKIIYIFFLINIFSINNLLALIEVDITRGNLDPLPIAISPLHVDIKSEKYKDLNVKDLGEKISEIIEKNFRNTGLFNPLKKDAFVQKPDIAHLKPRFEDWRLIKAQALVTGKLLISRRKTKSRVQTLGFSCCTRDDSTCFSQLHQTGEELHILFQIKFMRD